MFGGGKQSAAGELQAFFEGDHRRCDAQWAKVEGAAGDASALAAAFEVFNRDTRRHLSMEEEVLFPAFEEASGVSGGPTHVMRMEHAQMRALLDEMASCLADGDVEGLMDQGDTLLMLTQQHNVKEEGMLYPMCQRTIGHTWEALKPRLDSVV